MLLLTAWIRFRAARESRPNDLLAQTRLLWGNVGLAIIALVFVLIAFWRG